MKWMSPNKIVVGGNDHTIKFINTEKNVIEEILFTNHKVATCIDSISDSLILTGHEDSIIRMWDIRTGQDKSSSSQKHFEDHSSWVSQVRINSRVDNVFLSGSYDGTVKLWDLRNEAMPISTLKK